MRKLRNSTVREAVVLASLNSIDPAGTEIVSGTGKDMLQDTRPPYIPFGIGTCGSHCHREYRGPETRKPRLYGAFVIVEDTGIEPVTFALPARRSPS